MDTKEKTLTPILDGWFEFVRVVLPENCSEVQRSEMQKAFFCGASLLFSEMLKVDDAESEEAASALFEALNEEIQDFVQKMKLEMLDEGNDVLAQKETIN